VAAVTGASGVVIDQWYLVQRNSALEITQKVILCSYCTNM